MEEINFHHQKKTIALRHFFLGRKWFLAHDALELAKKFHTNKRKDNITPEFEHQLSIAGYLLSLENNLLFPEETVTTAFLHDLSEDYDIGYQEIKERFGEKISLSVQLLTKKYQGSKKDNVIYFQEMENNALASIVKGADRINNLQSMSGVFNNDKQKEYIKETEELIIPMLKNSRKIFPQQIQVYQNEIFVLRSQIKLIQQNI